MKTNLWLVYSIFISSTRNANDRCKHPWIHICMLQTAIIIIKCQNDYQWWIYTHIETDFTNCFKILDYKQGHNREIVAHKCSVSSLVFVQFIIQYHLKLSDEKVLSLGGIPQLFLGHKTDTYYQVLELRLSEVSLLPVPSCPALLISDLKGDVCSWFYKVYR